MLVAADALALSKVGEGFSSRVREQGGLPVPANAPEKFRAGQDVWHWVQYKGLAAGPTTQRCVVSDSPNGTPIVDETEVFDDWEPEGYSFCGYVTEARGFDGGTYHFTQYLNGERIGGASILVEERAGRTNVYKEFKFWLGMLAVLIVCIAWVHRKWTGRGEDAGADEPAPAANGSGRPVVTIGSHVNDAPGAAAALRSAAPAADESAVALRKSGEQFEMLMKQPDKARGVEHGRSYLGMLLAADDKERAVEVFKRCLAADPSFRPTRPEDVLPLAKAARKAGDHQAAVAAVRGFDKTHPGHSLIPDVYVFSAKLMAEDLANSEMARKILNHVVAKYPGHHLAQEARRYLQALPQTA